MTRPVDALAWQRRPGQGAYARVERERRFLVADPPAGGSAVRRVEDRYLDGTTLRLRDVSADGLSVFKLTQKVRPDPADPSCVRLTNTYLTAAEHALLASLPAAVLVKTRTVFREGTHDVVVDELHGRWQGLWLAEVEVRSLDEPVPLPTWVGREVTHDDRFSGGRLARADDAEVAELLAGR